MTPAIPIIDLADRAGPPSEAVVAEVAHAAEHFGFFQVINHGVAANAIDDLWRATETFFAQPIEAKRELMRSKDNSRGYYDRELTKNARDQKEVLDISFVERPDLPDDHPANVQEVDGRNYWPELPGFRDIVVEYLQAANTVGLWLLEAFCRGLGEHAMHLHADFGSGHTSFLRMNHYPLNDVLSANEAGGVTALGDMALHHHSDSGALTLLLQDQVGGLQVRQGDKWIDVEPVPGALVVNTGDMMQVWSNDRYHAALHRVIPRTTQPRFSLPYFFNPRYETVYSPLPGSIAAEDVAHYRPINWGDFRQARADGDFADYGAEIQITDFAL